MMPHDGLDDRRRKTPQPEQVRAKIRVVRLELSELELVESSVASVEVSSGVLERRERSAILVQTLRGRSLRR